MARVDLCLISSATAQRLRELTSHSEHQISAVRVAAGSYEGWYAFSANAVVDPALADLVSEVTTRRATLDTEIAWPTPPEAA